MNTRIVLFVVVCFVAFPFSSARADANGHVNFFLGEKSLDDYWSPSLDRQPEFGAAMSFGRDNWPLHIAADVLVSGKDTTLYDPSIGSVKVSAATFEIELGVRKIWKVNHVLPYFGGGVGGIGAALHGESGAVSVDASQAALGFWADAGVFFRLGSHFNLGLDVRYSSAKVELDFGNGFIDRDVEAGGLHYGVLLGFGW